MAWRLTRLFRIDRLWMLTLGAALAVAAAPVAASADNVIVTATTNGNKTTITIRGDSDANDITITQMGGNIVITGNGTTTINFGGMNQFPVPNKLKIEMGHGSDTVAIDGIDVDKVRVTDTNDDPNVPGTDGETVTVQNATIDDLKVRTGAGEDSVTSSGSEIEDHDVQTDGGTDTVIGFDEESDELSINLGSGDDVLILIGMQGGSTNLNLGPGHDDVLIGLSNFDRTKLQGASGQDCFVDSENNDFGHPYQFNNFEPEACDTVPPVSGRAVSLDFETGPLMQGDTLCLSDIVAGGCTFTGPECTNGGELLHLHDTIAIEQVPDVFFPDQNVDGCGHGVVSEDVEGCGPDSIPACDE